MENQVLLEKFYEAFAHLDSDQMIECYHDDVTFEDPAFGVLKGEQAKNMWRMLCRRAKDFHVSYSKVEADETTGSVHWEATYKFEDRKVHNIVNGKFKFKDGKIIDHRDSFNLYRWSRQALGPIGTLIGWTPFFQSSLRAKTKKQLKRFEEKLKQENALPPAVPES